jgi:hypothetical protein
VAVLGTNREEGMLAAREEAPVVQDAAVLAITGDRSWQKRMLPLMVRLVLALTIFFFTISLVQLTYLHWTIRQAPPLNLTPALTELRSHPPATFEQRLKLAELEMMAGLDAGTVEQRYHQVSAMLMARVWKGYMGFVTGMILAMVGALFILGKMQEPVSVSSDGQGGPLSIRSTSPGLVMCFLGMILMGITIVVNHRIDIVDAPGNLRYYQSSGSQQAVPGFPPPPEDSTRSTSK